MLPIRLFLLPLALGFLINCSSSTQVRKALFENKALKYSIAYDSEGRMHGLEEWWHPNGQLKFRGQNLHGERHGEFTAWNADGSIWYQGYADQGRKDSTLTYFHPNGIPKVVMTYDQGRLLQSEEFQPDGRKKETPEEMQARQEAEAKAALAKSREADLKVWVLRVRKTMEGYWRPPQGGRAVRNRAVAKITVRSDGKILDAKLIKPSENAAFNREALNTFKRIKGFPPLPKSHPGSTIDIQYEFVPPASNKSPERR